MLKKINSNSVWKFLDEKFLYLLGLFILICAIKFFWPHHSPSVQKPVQSSSATQLAPNDDPTKFSNGQLLVALNDYRVENGVPPLNENVALDATALAHAQDMQARGYYNHITPEGVTPLQRIDNAVGHVYAGENEDALCVGANTNTEMSRFSGSPEHKTNMLDPKINSVGIGWVGSDYSTCNGYLVYDFAQL